MKISSAGITSKGNIRTNNEDNFYINGEFKREKDQCTFALEDDRDLSAHLYAVCDGMGGYSSGEDASLKALEVLEQMDQKITAPAQGRFQTSIFTDAYLCYARMFAQYGSSFPEGEFKKDIPQALHLLARALTLIDDEAYTTKIINEIKDIADQY